MDSATRWFDLASAGIRQKDYDGALYCLEMSTLVYRKSFTQKDDLACTFTPKYDLAYTINISKRRGERLHLSNGSRKI